MMSGLERDALLLDLIDQLRERGSWAGETHVQKATYFLQELTRVPLGFDFIMYKYGPYSFDLHDELTAMQANQLLGLKPQLPYGPTLWPGEMSPVLKKRFRETIDRYQSEVRFIAEKLGQRPGLRHEDVLINLVEVPRENWSFGNGLMTFSPAP